jgi:localization factor PodJL
MKSGIPWSVKGIEPDVREAAKDAARRSGLTLGEWLNAAIIERAETTPVQPSRFIHPRVRERLDSITDELAMMTAERPSGTHARHVESLAPQKEFRIDYDAVIDRIENSERYVSEALASVNDRLQSLKHQIVELAGATTRVSDDEGYMALEAALRNIVGHLEISERRTHEALRSVEDQVAMLARAEPAEPGFHRDEAEGRFQHAESRIAELAGKLDALARDRSRANQDALQQSVDKLADRIEWVHRTADTTAQRARDGAIAATQSELGKLEEQIRSIAAIAQASAKNSSASQAEIARLRSDIESLNQRIDDIRTEVAAERDLHSVRLTIEQLSTRVAQLPEQRSFGDLDRRVSELSQRLSELRPPDEVLPQITDIEQRVYELEGRLAEGTGSGAEQAGLDVVQQQIDQMNARLGATEDRMSGMAAIERSISQLFRALEDHREDAHDIAEDAARRVAQEFLQREAQPAGPSPELVALEEALAAVKDHAARSDQQTQETLQAVHETLEEIVNKLADLEAGQQVVLEERHAASAPAAKHDTRLSGGEIDRADTASEAPAWQSAVQHLAGQQRASAHERKPEAAQAEPSAAESGAAMDFFVEPQAGIVEFQNPDAPQHSHAPASDDDYIAAARRAAQAAAQGTRLGMGKLPYGEQNGTKLATKARRGFSFSLLRRAPALKPRHPPGVSETVAVAADTAAMPQDRGRKRLLLAALLLLAAVSGVALRNSFNEPAPAPHHSEPAKSSPNGGAGKGTALQSDPLSSLIDPLATGSLGKDARRAITEQQTTNNDILLADTTPLAPAIAPESVRLAAMSGDAEAQFVIGGRFLDGTGVAQDFTQAAKWYHRAALQGLAPAQYRLATLFERGSGVQQDKREARTWYQRAALKGNVRAMHNLGVLLAGLTPPDYAHAAHWFRQAAEHGVQDSQYNLALLEERGLGLSEDASEAYFWFSVAAEAGDNDAKSRAQLLEESLPLALKITVRQRLKTFKPKSPETSANVVPLSDQWTAGERSPGLM